MAALSNITMLSLGDLYFTDGEGNYRLQWSTTAVVENIRKPNAADFGHPGDYDNDYYKQLAKYNYLTAHKNDKSDTAAKFVCRVYDLETKALVREVETADKSATVALDAGEYLWEVAALDKSGKTVATSERFYICTGFSHWDAGASWIDHEGSSPSHVLGEVGACWVDENLGEWVGDDHGRLAVAGAIENTGDGTTSRFLVCGPASIGNEEAWNAAQNGGFAFSPSNAFGGFDGDFNCTGNFLVADGGLYAYEDGEWNYKAFAQPHFEASEAGDDCDYFFIDAEDESTALGNKVFCWSNGAMVEKYSAKSTIWRLCGNYCVTPDGVFSIESGRQVMKYNHPYGEMLIYNDAFLNVFAKDKSGKSCEELKAGRQGSIVARYFLFDQDTRAVREQEITLFSGTPAQDIEGDEVFVTRIGNCFCYALYEDWSENNLAVVNVLNADGTLTTVSRNYSGDDNVGFSIDGDGNLVYRPNYGEAEVLVAAGDIDWTLAQAPDITIVDDDHNNWRDMKTLGPASHEIGAFELADGTAGWVGDGDDVDYLEFELSDAAKLCLTVSATDATKFTINQLVETTKNGTPTYSLKALQSISVKSGALDTKELLLQSGKYYLGVESTNAKKGGSSNYSVGLNTAKTVFFTDGDNGYNNYLYATKSKTLNPDIAGFQTTVLDKDTTEVAVDGGVDHNGFKNFVGYGDDTDFATITLDSAASLSFAVTATDAAKFTVNQLVEGKNGTYTVKALQTTSLAKAKGAENYTATTKNLLLEAGDYYISLQSTNAAKGGAAYYNVELAPTSVFFTDGDDGYNNWLYDAKPKILNPRAEDFLTTAIGNATGEVAFDSDVNHNGWSNFVGYGDDTDFATITLDEAASLSFDVEATDAAKFTVSQLIKNANGTYTVKALQTTSLAKAKGAENYSATTKNLKLGSGTYYVSVQSTNAAKGGAAYYSVALNQGKTDFYENLFVDYDADLSCEQQPNGTNVVLNWAASPADAKRKVTYYVSIDGGSETKVTKTTYTFKNLAMTDHVASVYARDEFGNVSEVFEQAFHIDDTVAPKVSGITVTVKDLGGNYATFFVKATDNVGIKGYHVIYDDEEEELYFDAADYDPAVGKTLGAITYGKHTITLTAEDISGNLSAPVTKEFTLKPPSGTMALDTSGAILKTDENVDGVDYGQHKMYFHDSISAGTRRLYKFAIENSATLRIELTEDPSATATLYREVSEGLVVKVTSQSVRDDHFTICLDTPGVYYLDYAAGKKNSWWDITLSLANPDNNTFATASDMTDAMTPWGDFYGGDNFYLGASDPVDWYKFTITNPGNYYYGAYDAELGGAKQTLYDAAGNELVASKKVSAHDVDELPKKYLAAGDYYLKMEWTGKTAEYNLGLLKA